MFILLLIVLISSFCTETSSKQVTDSGDTAQTQSWSSVDATAPFSKEGTEVNKLDGDLGPQPCVYEDGCPDVGERSRGYNNHASLFKVWIRFFVMLILPTWAAMIDADMFPDFGDVVTSWYTSPRSVRGEKLATAEADMTCSSGANAFAPNGKIKKVWNPFINEQSLKLRLASAGLHGE